MNLYDVIIIGTGIGGLFTALNIEEDKNILMITKSDLGSGSSKLAQGGIVACKNKKSHYKDTLVAGSFYNNKEAVRVLQNDASFNINKLIELGVNFDKDKEGNLLYTKEGGHSEPRILHCRDTTGEEIIKVLKDKVKKRKNITIKENEFVADIIHKNGVNMVITVDSELKAFYGNTIVIATGGVGQIYENTTNPIDITGDGIALARRAGIKVCDMEFIQFHPTGMYEENGENASLISEAIRGEGGILRNIKGERFMEKYHEMKDLAPRDIVSRSIFKEIIETKSDYVYLDVTHLDGDYIKKRFPNIYKMCLSKGVDITKDYIKVSPTQHYLIGGIETDLKGRTGLNDVYACGECTRTGVHGANRLASNSLLEGIVFANIIADEINSLSLNKLFDKDIESDPAIYKNHVSPLYIL